MRLNQVTLAVGDLDRSVDFYRRLGLKQIVADESYARFACPDGEGTLSLEQLQTVPPSATTVYLECEDLDATVSRLAVAGLGFEHPPIDQPWLWREARLRDPDGNPLCLFRAGEKPTQSTLAASELDVPSSPARPGCRRRVVVGC